MMMRTILSALLAGLLSLSCAAAEDVSYERIRFELLPDMKTPRAGHLMLVTGNEITVFAEAIPTGSIRWGRACLSGRGKR